MIQLLAIDFVIQSMIITERMKISDTGENEKI